MLDFSFILFYPRDTILVANIDCVQRIVAMVGSISAYYSHLKSPDVLDQNFISEMADRWSPHDSRIHKKASRIVRPVKPITNKQEPNAGPYSAQGGQSRREFIRFLALGCAGLLSADALAGNFPGTRKQGGAIRKGQILSEDQMRLLRDFVEVIIPQTGTPGAAATDTHGFIDDQLANCQSPVEASQFIGDLDKAGSLIEQHWSSAFSKLAEQDQKAVMTAIANRATPFETLAEDFFKKLKSLTIIAYYSSEAGASEELVYLPVPGGYDGDYKVSDNDGKAFSPQVY